MAEICSCGNAMRYVCEYCGETSDNAELASLRESLAAAKVEVDGMRSRIEVVEEEKATVLRKLNTFESEVIKLKRKLASMDASEEKKP